MSLLIDDVVKLNLVLSGIPKADRLPSERVLMVSPRHFQVEYAINPFMKDDSGKLKAVDNVLAQKQWDGLKETYEKLGYQVEIIPAQEGLPDMVFAANQSFPFWSPRGKGVLMSRMRSGFRAAEVPYFTEWYARNGYEVYTLACSGTFEGNGDAALDPRHRLIWGGFGPRTDASVYNEISERFGFAVARLELVSSHFYHLDTCFSILDGDTVVIQPDAFSLEGRRLLRARFSRVIEVGYEANMRFFGGNCHCPNGKDVLMQKGDERLTRELEKEGFRPHLLNTSEFLKSGGSVFCMKMIVF